MLLSETNHHSRVVVVVVLVVACVLSSPTTTLEARSGARGAPIAINSSNIKHLTAR